MTIAGPYGDYNKAIKTVKIQNGVTSIGDYAFDTIVKLNTAKMQKITIATISIFLLTLTSSICFAPLKHYLYFILTKLYKISINLFNK